MGWMDLMGDRSLGGKQFAALFGALAVGVFGLTASLPANAQLGGAATTGVSTTKHNLGSAGAGTNVNKVTQTTEVCVFCHTPHAANTSDGPLWNRPSSAVAITPYSSTTLVGGKSTNVTIADAPGAVSLACLSCHDGVTATNTLINGPGSGYNLTAGRFGTTTPADGLITGVAAIGRDLSNDHPIGVKYAGGRTVAADQIAGGYVQYTSGSVGGGSAFWVDTGTTGTAPGGTDGVTTDSTRQKTDMFLYARAGEAYVECASCHDPHTSTPLFLRIANNHSSVCLSCHIK